jgi:hypothetical protein
VDGGWADDRCNYLEGPVPSFENCNGTRQNPQQYAYDKLQALVASCSKPSYCPLANLGNCYTTMEDAWRKNTMWLRYLAQRGVRCGRISIHNQLMAKWQVSDITAVAHSQAEHAEGALGLFRFIKALRLSMGISTRLHLVQFEPGMGFCVAGCCDDASISPEQIRQLVARTEPKTWPLPSAGRVHS